jgi:hypothetical protein
MPRSLDWVRVRLCTLQRVGPPFEAAVTACTELVRYDSEVSQRSVSRLRK